MQKKRIFAIMLFVVTLTILLISLTAHKNRTAMQTGMYSPQQSVVILDAGHGGFDGGATAGDGTLEKDINMQIVRKLHDLLHAAGIQTILTRTDDNSIHDPEFISIRRQKISDIHNRLRIMEQTQNSIFVSIHQNHFTSSLYHGAQVFYSGNDAQSKILAAEIQLSVSSLLQPDNRREIKQSGTEIYLLYHAMRPAVMVECGFLSNAQETKLLKSDTYQQKLAIAIYNGIVNFMEDTEVV